MKLVLATGNAGKLREIRALLGDDFEVVSQGELGIEDAIEDGDTFRANALIKARHACAASGLAALADDSGLEVDALGGAPGVRSARYAGPTADDRANVEKLLRALDSVPLPGRGARFRCCMVYLAGVDAEPEFFEGAWEGRIAPVPAGDGGFGYDPVFIPDGVEVTAAELEPGVKNRLSHRAQALEKLLAAIMPRP